MKWMWTGPTIALFVGIALAYQQDQETACGQCAEHPIISTALCCEMAEPLLDPSDFMELQNLTSDLPVDPYLPNRFKLIGFASSYDSGEVTWDTSERGHFLIGNAAYENVPRASSSDRHYDIFPKDLRESSAMRTVVNKFRKLCDIQDDSAILVQAQRTQHIHKHVDLDVTYEGIHSGGGKCAMFFSYLRSKIITGCENSLLMNETRESTIWGPKVLEENRALFFRDKELYHDVSAPVFEHDAGARGIYLLHWPAEPYRTMGNMLRHPDGSRLYVAQNAGNTAEL